MSSPQRRSAAAAWQPTKPAAPVTRTERPRPLVRLTRAEARTFFSQAAPPQVAVEGEAWRERRRGSMVVRWRGVVGADETSMSTGAAGSFGA